MFIIESGVVTVTLTRHGTPFESGRMGPGEVIGEAGILSDSSVPAKFAAKTFCALYRIEKTYLKPCLDARHDISDAMKTLLDYRLHKAQSLTEEAPVVVAKKAFCNGCAIAPECFTRRRRVSVPGADVLAATRRR